MKLYVEVDKNRVTRVSTPDMPLAANLEVVVVDTASLGSNWLSGLVRTADGGEYRAHVEHLEVEAATITQALTEADLDQIVEDKHAAMIADADVPDPET